MQKCRKEMPVEDDYMMVIIPCIAEIAASDAPERVKKLRFGAVSELQRYLHYYRQLGYMPKLLYAIADKKCRMIGSATTKAEMQKLVRPVPFPVSWTVKMKKKQKETQDILSYHSQAAGCSDKARAKASGGRQPIEECGRTGL